MNSEKKLRDQALVRKGKELAENGFAGTPCICADGRACAGAGKLVRSNPNASLQLVCNNAPSMAQRPYLVMPEMAKICTRQKCHKPCQPSRPASPKVSKPTVVLRRTPPAPS